MSRQVELGTPDLPEFGLPVVEPQVTGTEYQARIEQTRRLMKKRSLDFLVVYGDREHFANLAYLTGFDPRFEEAMLILTQTGTPTLVVGNEGMGYSDLLSVPLERRLWQSFSLLGQPRDQSPPLDELVREAGIRTGMLGGVAGWKYYSEDEFPNAEEAFEVPAFLIDALRRVVSKGRLVNVTVLFMHSVDGLRSVNSVDQLAQFEFAATYASQAVRNVIFSLSVGMTEYEAAQKFRLPGIPLSCHPMLSSGPRAFYGLPSPSGRRLERGDPLTMAIGLWGGLTARAGFLVEDASQLEASIQDYVDKLVKPYFTAAVEWYETVGIGVMGRQLYDIVHRRLGDPFFGVSLNPGHLIHLDEWVHSPIFEGSAYKLKAGMAIQIDIIPATGTPYFTTNIEDTLALADEGMREEFAARYPEAWGRIETRRAFMRNELGIKLKPEVLPFSNLPAFLPPYLLQPSYALRACQNTG